MFWVGLFTGFVAYGIFTLCVFIYTKKKFKKKGAIK